MLSAKKTLFQIVENSIVARGNGTFLYRILNNKQLWDFTLFLINKLLTNQ